MSVAYEIVRTLGDDPFNEISICVDCLIFLANGDDQSEAGDIAERIEAQWSEEDPDLHWEIVPNCPEDCDGWFSWSSCDGCGSHLGGDRHPAVAILYRRTVTDA